LQIQHVFDLCFDIWGPEAQKIQKEMHDNDEAAPAVGKVSPKQKKAIQENFLMNDVSMALWTKVECINMTHGRVWDSGGYEPNGWFWSPAEDCAKKVKKFIQ